MSNPFYNMNNSTIVYAMSQLTIYLDSGMITDYNLFILNL